MLAVLVAIALAAEPVTIEVLDRGSEPRAVLAVAPPAGTVETVDLELAFAAEVNNEGVTLPQQMVPPLHLTLRSEVVHAGPTGFRAAVTVPSVEVGIPAKGGDDLRPAMVEAMAPMRALQGQVSVDPTGAPTEATWSSTDGTQVDPALVAELERAVHLLQVRRPAEALGVGARWTVTRSGIEEAGFAVTEVETWTVAGHDAGVWTLDVLTMAKAEVPQVVAGNVLESHRAAAQGRVTLDPQHLHPATVELGLSVRTRMKVDGVITSTTTSTLQAKATRRP